VLSRGMRGTNHFRSAKFLLSRSRRLRARSHARRGETARRISSREIAALIDAFIARNCDSRDAEMSVRVIHLTLDVAAKPLREGSLVKVEEMNSGDALATGRLRLQVPFMRNKLGRI